MSRQPFARRYWGTLTGDGMAVGAPADGREKAGGTHSGSATGPH
jgi:hypothetical protein